MWEIYNVSFFFSCIFSFTVNSNWGVNQQLQACSERAEKRTRHMLAAKATQSSQEAQIGIPIRFQLPSRTRKYTRCDRTSHLA